LTFLCKNKFCSKTNGNNYILKFNLYLVRFYIKMSISGAHSAPIYKHITYYKEDFIMAFKISDACVSCGACESQCPVGAISMGDGKFEIDADKCIDCGSCAGTCPTGSIEQE
jgi:ferredoxin